LARKPRRLWLMKSEPDVFSIHDLAREPDQTAHWDGVRNYKARNYLRDEIRAGDGVLFYHSNANPPGIAGTATVVRGGYPDHTAFDPRDPHFDPKSDPEQPRWFMVDIRLERIFDELIPLPELRDVAALEGMELLRRGSRLSVQPVRPEEWKTVLGLAARRGRLRP